MMEYFISAIISGSLATVVTILYGLYHDKISQKRRLVDDIFGYKYQLSIKIQQKNDINLGGFERALGRIPIVFDKNKRVLDEYDKFYDTLMIGDLEERKTKSNEALITLLKEICKAAKIKCANWNDSRFERVFTINND